MGLFSKEFGMMIMIFNFIYLLQFERFGDGNFDEDFEFKLYLFNFNQGYGVVGEFGLDESFYLSVVIYKVEKKVRMVYVFENFIIEVKVVLKILLNCFEVYNVLVQFEVKMYDEVFGKFYVVYQCLLREMN